MAAEIKGVDEALTKATVIATTNTNGDIFIPTLIAPGVNGWNRIGRRVWPRSLRIRGTAIHVYAPETTTLDLIGNTLRMVVVWDREPQAVLPTFDTIFGTTTQAGTEATTFLDPIKYDQSDRFKILRDVQICASAEATPFAGGTTMEVQNRFPIDEYISFPKGTNVLYGGQSDPCTIADVQSGACYIIFRAALLTSNSFWNIPSSTKSRLRYFD